jgi:hypothetical protein
MTDERADYLASGSGFEPPEKERLELIREVLADETTWAEPPPGVADQLIASIGAQKPGEAKEIPRRRSAPLIAATMAGVAAVVILVAGLMGVFAAPSENVIAIQGTELEPAASGEAAIREADAGWWIRLEVDDLPAADVGTYYEGWVWNDDGEGVSIGTFHLRGGDESVILWSGVDPADYPAIWVTLEDEDGDPSASDRIVLRGRPAEG